MPIVKNNEVLTALSAVNMYGDSRDIVSLDMISSISIKSDDDGSRVVFAIEIDPLHAKNLEPLRLAAEKAVQAISGITSVKAILTAHNKPQKEVEQIKMNDTLNIDAKHIFAVASGKGGVGKSTTAVNIAIALSMSGLKVGLLDADVYGPSIPRLLGLQGKPVMGDNDKLLPMKQHGIDVMSIGVLVSGDIPMIWRGPMVHGALTQMLRDVAWENLDALIIDMPPGTGDAQLTIAQQLPIAGAIIVSTPQDIALLDARKAIGMFNKTNVPILGIIENMSYFLCPNCGERSEIFGHGGARKDAEKLGIPFLGEVPLDLIVRETSDSGEPIVITQPDSEQAKNYRIIATRIWNAFK